MTDAVKEERVTLLPTEWGIEVRCSRCLKPLDRVPDERVAYYRMETYLEHECDPTSKTAA